MSLEQFDDSESVLKELTESQPKSPVGYVGLAWNAQRYQHWQLALQRWNLCLDKFPDLIDPEWLFSKGNVLVQLEYFNEAEQTYHELVEMYPDSPAGYAGLAQVAQCCQNWELALQRWDRCILQFSELPHPKWQSSKARMLMKLQRFDEAEQLFSDLVTNHPQIPMGRVGLAKLAANMGDLDLSIQRWEEVCALFNKDIEIVLDYIQSLNHKLVRFDRTQELCRTYLKQTGDVRFYIQLCESYLMQHDISKALAEVRVLIGRYPENWEAKILEARILLVYWTNDKIREAIEKLEGLSKSLPDSRKVASLLIKAYIRNGNFDAANQQIEQYLPESPAGPKLGRLSAWHQYSQGKINKAKQIYEVAYEKAFIIALHAPFSLERIDSNVLSPGKQEVFLFSPIKDNLKQLPWFFEYYRKLGVDRFFIVDNNSTDGTTEFLLQQPDVHVFSSSDNFAVVSSGMRWINELIEQYGEGHWCIFVDSDEALVFPGMEQHGLKQLLLYMDSKGHEAMFAFMLEMYPATPALQTSYQPGEDLLAYSPYFDNNYRFFNNHQCPYRFVKGGINERLFHTFELLEKVPLIKGGRGISYTGNHNTTPAIVSDATGVLLHFNLALKSNVADSVWSADSDASINAREGLCQHRYRTYHRILRELGDDYSYLCDTTKRFGGSQQLVDLGLVQYPADLAKM